MAKQSGNVVTCGLSRKAGDLLIFRQVDGKTVVSKVPEQPKTASEKQKTSVEAKSLCRYPICPGMWLKNRKRLIELTVYRKQTEGSPKAELKKNILKNN
jgi:hypothetical protein